MMISSENAGKLTEERKFPCAIYGKRIGSNSVRCQFSRCWVHKKYSAGRAKLKEDKNFKCQVFANQQTNIAEDCPSIESNGQSLEIIEMFCYLGGTIGAR